MDKERIKFYSDLTVTVIGAAIFSYVFFKFLFFPILPFLIAWAVAALLRPASKFISDRTHIPKRAVSFLLAIVTVGIGIGAVVALIVLGVRELWDFLSGFASDDRLNAVLDNITDPIGAIFGEGVIKEHLGEIFKNAISSLLGGLVEIIRSIASSVPKAMFFILVTVIAAVYFSLELETVNAFVHSHVPQGVSARLSSIKKRLLSGAVKYVKSYLILMVLTFFVILIGLLILRVRNALLIAALVALFDLLPIIGVGTVMVPWSIYQMIFGSLGTGIGLAVLFVVHEIVRQFAEPKILGKSFGIHPIVSLILLYIGYSLFGILGLIAVPLFGTLFGLVFDKDDPTEVT